VKGSHGLAPLLPEDGPILIASNRALEAVNARHHKDVAKLIIAALTRPG
jgi:hypothetical protein